jgi:type I restriction enzyme S subunit
MNELTLSDVAEIVMGQSPPGNTYNRVGNGAPLLNGPTEFGEVHPIATQWTTAPCKMARAGDVLFCVRGNTLGRQNISDRDYAIGRGLAAIRAKDGKAHTDFIRLLLRHKAEELLAGGNGSTFPSISGDELGSTSFPDVTLAQQSEIAAQLKVQLVEIETARDATKAQLRDASALPNAAYHALFGGTIPVSPPPLDAIPPAGWRWRKLTDVARLESGHTPSRFRADWWGGDISWLSLTEIRALDGTWVEETQLRTNAAGIANSAARVLPRGTVCLSRTASVGFVAIMAAPMATSQDFANWVCGDELNPEFLMYALICSRASLREMATGATHKTIYMPALESFHVCAPGIDEQKRIARRLKAQIAEVEILRASLSQRAADIAALPQRILAQAFEI